MIVSKVVIMNDVSNVTILPSLMILATLIAIAFLITYFSRVDRKKEKQLKELNDKLDEINRKLDM